jgi:hypothetical protein
VNTPKLFAHARFIGRARLGELSARLIFAFLLLLGVLVVADYGVTYDEYVNRRNGGISLNYVLQLIESLFQTPLLSHDPVLASYRIPLESYNDRDYGVAFDLPAMALERLLQINDLRSQYLLRHVLTYILFLTGCWAVYKTVTVRFSSVWLGVCALIMMILSPRIFADAFYNSKDIVFMSAVALATYAMQKMFCRKDLSSAVVFALATAFAINVRIIGIIFIVATVAIFIVDVLGRKRSLSAPLLVAYLAVTVLLTIGFWPWLWSAPADNFMLALSNMSNFRWNGWVLYIGNYYTSTNLPRHYLPGWILISTPLLYVALFCIGACSIIKSVVDNKFEIWKNSAQLQDLISLGILVSPLLFVLFKRSVVYDGWRQFYFVYPAFICIAIRGLTWTPHAIAFIKPYRLMLSLLLCVTAVQLTVWMVRAHPFQNMYFNVLVPDGPAQNFELDYWGTSNVRGLQFLLEYQPSGVIRVSQVGITSLAQSLAMLDESERARIQVIDEPDHAEYCITNFRFINPQQRGFLDSSSWLSIHSIVVDTHVISQIFKKK